MPAPSGRVALLLGATGLVGGHCLDLLLENPRYSRVRVLTRRRFRRRHSKLEIVVVDFDLLAERPELFRVDDVFCALGSTIAKAGSAEAFRRVDFDYVAEAARLASEEGAEQFLLVSSIGADPASRAFYTRTKGEVEVAVKHHPFRAVWIVRPSLLRGEREELRVGELAVNWVARIFGFLFIGRLRRYRPVEAHDVAAALVNLAADDGTGGVVESEEIPALAAGVPPE